MTESGGSEIVERLKASLKQEEGFSSKPYRDGGGKLTIGYGTNLDAGVDQIEADFLLMHRILLSQAALDQDLPWWRELDPVRQEALLDLCYNMGIGGLLGFKRMLAALEAGQYKAAASELTLSLWIKQVQVSRSNRIKAMIETGKTQVQEDGKPRLQKD